MSRHVWRPAALAAFALAILYPPPTPLQARATFEVVASGLFNPRGLSFGPEGALYVAEAGTCRIAARASSNSSEEGLLWRNRRGHPHHARTQVCSHACRDRLPCSCRRLARAPARRDRRRRCGSTTVSQRLRSDRLPVIESWRRTVDHGPGERPALLGFASGGECSSSARFQCRSNGTLWSFRCEPWRCRSSGCAAQTSPASARSSNRMA